MKLHLQNLEAAAKRPFKLANLFFPEGELTEKRKIHEQEQKRKDVEFVGNVLKALHKRKESLPEGASIIPGNLLPAKVTKAGKGRNSNEKVKDDRGPAASFVKQCPVLQCSLPAIVYCD